MDRWADAEVFMMKTQPHYQSFILRLWQERGLTGETAVSWRFSLENTESGQRLGFNQLEDVCNFLKRQTYDPTSDSPSPEP